MCNVRRQSEISCQFKIFFRSDTEEEVQARHRKEKKELQAKITALKKSSGKKNKKDVQTEIEKLEKELDLKHLEELKNLKITEVPSSDTSKQTLVAPEAFISNSNDNDQPQRVSKAQKRREKKNEKERERQAEMRGERREKKTPLRSLSAES